jgi:hypothetical protein
MSEQNETNNTEETTSDQDVSPEVTKTEVVEISLKELELLRKKGADFDGIIEKQRLAKLAKRETHVEKTETDNENIDVDAIIERAKNEAREETHKIIQDNNRQTYDENLAQAYRQVKANHKWIDDDEIIANISKEFHPGSSLSVADLAKRLEVTAANLYPDQYKSSLESTIKAQVLAGNQTITTGAGSSTGTQPPHKDNEVAVSKDDQRIADKYFGGDIQRYLKSKKT